MHNPFTIFKQDKRFFKKFCEKLVIYTNDKVTVNIVRLFMG